MSSKQWRQVFSMFQVLHSLLYSCSSLKLSVTITSKCTLSVFSLKTNKQKKKSRTNKPSIQVSVQLVELCWCNGDQNWRQVGLNACWQVLWMCVSHIMLLIDWEQQRILRRIPSDLFVERQSKMGGHFCYNYIEKKQIESNNKWRNICVILPEFTGSF